MPVGKVALIAALTSTLVLGGLTVVSPAARADDSNATPSPVAAKVIADLAAFKGVTAKGEKSDEEIVAALLYPVVNEAAKVLEEGIALRASDIDVACILGYNWPVYTGGPMFWADTVGLTKIVDGLKVMGIEPAKLLLEKAQSGASFTR